VAAGLEVVMRLTPRQYAIGTIVVAVITLAIALWIKVSMDGFQQDPNAAEFVTTDRYRLPTYMAVIAGGCIVFALGQLSILNRKSKT
jgi:cytochrome bd-type quinol oxidase subunit 1